MATIAKGIYPAPVYIAITEDGAEHRLSFWSPKGKPVDCERGRRVADSILLTDWESMPRWERDSDGAIHGKRPMRDTILTPTTYEPRDIVTYAAYMCRPKTGGVYTHTARVKQKAAALGFVDHGRIVARFIEHPTIGRIEDGAAIVTKPQARVNWQKRASEARELLERGNVTAALALLAA